MLLKKSTGGFLMATEGWVVGIRMTKICVRGVCLSHPANDKQKQLFLSLFSNFAKSLPSYGKISSGYFKILESILVDTLKSENKQHSEHIKEIFN